MVDNVNEGWSQRLAAAVGARVRQFRTTEDISAQTLANRTAQLGYEVKRSVIADMESGRRSTVSLADVLVLARALGVPPVALLVDAHKGTKNEILPGTPVDVWEAADWITGRSARLHTRTPDVTSETDRSTDDETSPWHVAGLAFELKRQHDSRESQLIDAHLAAQAFKDEKEYDSAMRLVSVEFNELRRIRDEMKRKGFVQPVPVVRDRPGESDLNG